MRDAIGITVYTADRLVHKIGYALGVLIFVIRRIHKALIVLAGLIYITAVIANIAIKGGFVDWWLGLIGAMLTLPLLYVFLSEPTK